MPTFDTPGPHRRHCCLSPVLRCGSPRATGPTPWCWSNPIDKASQSDVKGGQQDQGSTFAGGQLSVKNDRLRGQETVRSSSRSNLPAGSSLVAYLAHSRVHADGLIWRGASCTWHRGRVPASIAFNALHANIAAGEGHDRPDRRGAPTIGRWRRSHCGSARSRTPSSSRARVGQTWIGHASADPRSQQWQAAVSTSTAPTAASPPRQPMAPFGSGRLTRGSMRDLMNGSGNIEVGISEGHRCQGWTSNSERGSVRNSVPSQENPDTSDNKVTVHARNAVRRHHHSTRSKADPQREYLWSLSTTFKMRA